MARSVKFHGQVVIHPGAEVFVDVSGMVQPSVDETRIAAVVAEAPHGQPGVVHVFADAESAKQYFGAGSPMADAIQLLYKPSNDERVDGGAAIVYAYKPNRSSRAEHWLVQDPVAGALTFAVSSSGAAKYGKDPTGADSTRDPANAYVEFSAVAGTYATNEFQNMVVEVISGWGKGQQRQIESSLDVAGAKHRLYLRADLDWDVAPHHATNSPTIRIAVPMHKLMADEWGPRGLENEVEFGPATLSEAFELASRYATRVETQPAPFGGLVSPTMHIKFDPTGGGNFTDWSNPVNWLIPQAQDGGSGVAGKTVANPNLSNTRLNGKTSPAGDLTANAHANRWVLITGVKSSVPAQAPLLGKLFKIKENTDATPVDPGQDNTLILHGEGLDLPAGTDLTDIEWMVVALTDAYFKITGEDGESQTMTLYVQDGATFNDDIGSVNLALTASLTSLVQQLNQLPGITARLGDGVDGDLLPSRFDFGDRSEHWGREPIGLLNAGIAPGATTAVIKSTGNLEGSDPFPTTGYNYFVVLGEGTANEEIVPVSNNNTGTETLTFLANAVLNAHSADDVVARVANREVGYRWGSQMVVGPGDTDNDGAVVKDNNQKLVEWVTANIGRFEAERADGPGSSTYKDEIGAAHPENNLDVYKRFYNGVEGTSVVQQPAETDPLYPISWEHGFDELMKKDDIRLVVPCASDDLTGWTAGDIDLLTVLFQNHLKDSDANRAERQGFMGRTLPLEAGSFNGVTYQRGLLEWIKFLNDDQFQLSGQTTRVFSSSGRETTLPPWAYACQVAGVRMGTPLGEPATLKYVKTSELGQPLNDWSPRSPLDIRKALLGGLLYGEPYKGRWRIVRDYTTHIATDNLARTDGQIVEIRNEITRDMRDKLESRFGGRGIGTTAEGVRTRAPVTTASVREAVATILDEDYRAEGIIIDSEDENQEPVHAWVGLSVKINGDVVRVKVQVFPKTGANFILVDFNFQLPSLSA